MAFGKQTDELTSLSGELVKRLNENSRRIRLLEQKLDKIEGSMEMLEQTALNQTNDLKINLERIIVKITSIGDRLSGIESDIMRVNKELGRTATKAEVKQMETFIDLVNPITSKFVTKDEMNRALEERLGRKA